MAGTNCLNDDHLTQPAGQGPVTYDFLLYFFNKASCACWSSAPQAVLHLNRSQQESVRWCLVVTRQIAKSSPLHESNSASNKLIIWN